MSVHYLGVSLLLCCYAFARVTSGNDEAIFRKRPGRYLGNHVLRSLTCQNEFICSQTCLNEPNCVSANFKVNGTNRYLCELNSKTLKDLEGEDGTGYVYLEILKRVRNNIVYSTMVAL